MDYEKTLEELKYMKVETGSFVCLGCGHEHNCSIHGCAILRDAVECIEEMKRVLQESEAARADLGKRLAEAQRELAEIKAERDAVLTLIRGDCRYCKHWLNMALDNTNRCLKCEHLAVRERIKGDFWEFGGQRKEA